MRRWRSVRGLRRWRKQQGKDGGPGELGAQVAKYDPEASARQLAATLLILDRIGFSGLWRSEMYLGRDAL